MFDGIRNKLSHLLKPKATNKQKINPSAMVGLPFAGYTQRSYGQKYDYGLSTAYPSLILDHAALRAQSRKAYHQSTLGKAIIDTFTRLAIGDGVTPQPAPMANILGISQEDATNWATQVKELFELYAMAKNQNRSGLMSFYQAQKFHSINYLRDGECFVRFYYSDNKKLLNPLQFEFVDPNQILGQGYTTTTANVSGISEGLTATTGSLIYPHDGIERNVAGKEIAYNVIVQNKKTAEPKFVRIPAIDSWSGRIIMLHSFEHSYAGQLRGLPKIADVIQELENLTDFVLAQISCAINQSNMYMYVKPSKDNAASNPWDGKIGAAGPIESAPLPGQPDIPTNQGDFAFQLLEATRRRPGSDFMANLEAGEELDVVKNTAPSAEYDKFSETFSAFVSAATGIPIEMVLMKFGQNYSASRATFLLADQSVKQFFNDQVTDYYNPTYQMWLAGEIARGTIKAPGWSDPRMRAAWAHVSWNRPPWGEIDELKAIKADELAVEMGLTTLEKLAREKNNTSAKHNRQQLNKEFEDLPKVPWKKEKTPL
jgi:lambda family phage portal protein